MSNTMIPQHQMTDLASRLQAIRVLSDLTVALSEADLSSDSPGWLSQRNIAGLATAIKLLAGDGLDAVLEEEDAP